MYRLVSDYKYSSYGEYITGDSRLVDINYVLNIVDKDSFVKFNNESKTDSCMDIADEVCRINDTDGATIMQRVSNCANSAEFLRLDIPQRNLCIKKLKQEGLSIRQISRLTGVSVGISRKL